MQSVSAVCVFVMCAQADSGEVGDDDAYDECTGLNSFIDCVVNDETDDVITDENQQTQPAAATGRHLHCILFLISQWFLLSCIDA